MNRIYFLILSLMFVSTAVLADAKQDFNTGVKYFSKGEYSQAIKSFLKAEKQGMADTALFYNMASAYYKVANYKSAELYFIKAGKDKKMRPLALYNLGLIALKKADKKSAINWFEEVIEITEDKKLKRLAENQLSKLKVKKTWWIYANAGLGRDDNVNFSPTGGPSNISDAFYKLIATADYLMSGTYENGWIADVSFYDLDYSSAKSSTSDFLQYGAGVKKTQGLGSWNLSYLLHIDKGEYGGLDYQTLLKMQVTANTKLAKNESLQLRYRYQDINSNNVVYNYLEGWKQKFRVQYKKRSRSNKQRYYYELELNDRTDTAFSPTRHTVQGVYTHMLDKYWHVSGDLAYRQSHYPDVGVWSRDDDRLKAAIYGDYQIDKATRFRVRWAYTDNESTQNNYDYTRNVISLDISKRF